MTARYALYGCPEKFRESLATCTHGYFSEIVNGLLLRSIVLKCVQNLKFIAFPIPEIIGCNQKILAVPGYAHAPSYPNFNGLLFSVNVPAKFEVRTLTRSGDNSGYLKTLGSPWIRRSRSSKIIDFGTNRKRVCDFLLGIGPILRRFGDIAVFCAPE